MHFNRKAAMIACEAYDKIRVNPGNFADGRKTFEEIDYDVTGGVLGTRRWRRVASMASTRSRREVDAVGERATRHAVAIHTGPAAVRR